MNIKTKYAEKQQADAFEIKDLAQLPDDDSSGSNIPGRRLLHQIIRIKQGAGKLRVDLDTIDIKDNMIYCLEPGQFYQFQFDGRINGYRISFPDNFLRSRERIIPMKETPGEEHTQKNKVMLFAVPVTEDMEQVFDAILKEYSGSLLLKPDLLRDLLKVFYIYLARGKKTALKQTYDTSATSLMNKFLQLVSENITTKKTLSDYASGLAISPCYLNHVIKKVSGFTASHHIHQFKMMEAKKRIAWFGYTMKETAYSLGFDDIYHFSKFFKKNCGKSFRQFKKEANQTAA